MAKYFLTEMKTSKKREAITQEKSKLITMMLNEKMKGGKTKAPMKREDINFHCDTLEALKN